MKKNRQNTIFCRLKCLSFSFFRIGNLKFKKIVQLFCFFRTQKEDFVWCEEAKERKNFLFINKSLFALAAVVVVVAVVAAVVVVAAAVVVAEADRKLQCVSTILAS